MKKFLLSIILAACFISSRAAVQFNLKYNAVLDRFEVYFVSTLPFAPANVGPSVVSVAFSPVYNINAITVTSVNGGAWVAQDKITGTTGTLNGKKVVGFESGGAPIANVVAGTEYMLFNFTFGAGANCTGTLRMFVNTADPSDPGGTFQDFTSYLFITPTEYDATNSDQNFYNCAALTVVPVRFLSFTAVRSGNDGLLNWQVGNEDANTDHYDVERSLNRVDFSSIKSVTALNNGRANNSYPLRDPNIIALKASVIYYRIKQFDRDGRFIYSEIKTLRMKDDASSVFLYPNPARNYVNVEADLAQAEQVSIRITDGGGKEVNRTEFKGSNGLNLQRINVSNLAAGRYVLTIMMGTETQSIPFVKSN